MKQFKLKDFDGSARKCLTDRVCSLVSVGWSYKKIASFIGLKSKQSVAYYVGKGVKQGLLVKDKSGVWVSGSEESKLFALGGASVKSVRVENWGKHAVYGVFPIRRNGDWGRVESLCDRVVLIKPAQFVFKSGDVTLTVRKRSVKVNVYNLQGSKLGLILERAREVARVALGDFMVNYGFELGPGEFHASNADWVLSKELSKPFLRFKPDLSDASHPEQVEVDRDAQREIESLLSGSLRREMSGSVSELAKVVILATRETQRAVTQQVDVSLLLQDIQVRLERIEGRLK